MDLKARIRWHFKPPDYFEEPLSSEFDNVQIAIEAGEVIAELDLARYESEPEIQVSLGSHIRRLFEGARVFSHKDFELTRGTVEKDRPGGGREMVVSVEPVQIKIVANPIDVRMTDAEGNVIVDTRQDRVDARRELAQLVASLHGTDETLNTMVESYANAVRDPADELVHLYEIRELLVSHFGDEEAARSAVSISRRKWSSLGRLANDEPLNQGRHRGRAPMQLRDATADELDKARLIARRMIVGYAKHISN